MAHFQDLGDVCHRQPVLVRLPDRVIAVDSQLLGSLLQFRFTPGVLVGERNKLGAGFRCLALGTGDFSIVRLILANRLA